MLVRKSGGSIAFGYGHHCKSVEAGIFDSVLVCRDRMHAVFSRQARRIGHYEPKKDGVQDRGEQRVTIFRLQ